ncbi:MAG: rod shape-determining protein MreC [Patescibacteria group bacterium]
MVRKNLKIFAWLLAIILFFIFLKQSRFFDLGFLVRAGFLPNQPANSLLQKPDDMQRAYQELLSDNNRLQALAQENQQLRDLLDFKNQTRYNLLPGQLISRDAVNHNIVTINLGRSQGLVEGQAVVVNKGIMVGKVMEVSSDTAKVRLLSDSFSKLTVSVSGQPNVSGLLTGSLGLGMDLSYIPQSQEIKQNDILVTTNLDLLIPPGLVVGKVEEVKAAAEELFKQAAVTPLVDLNNLTIVAVIISG